MAAASTSPQKGYGKWGCPPADGKDCTEDPEFQEAYFERWGPKGRWGAENDEEDVAELWNLGAHGGKQRPKPKQQQQQTPPAGKGRGTGGKGKSDPVKGPSYFDAKEPPEETKRRYEDDERGDRGKKPRPNEATAVGNKKDQEDPQPKSGSSLAAVTAKAAADPHWVTRLGLAARKKVEDSGEWVRRPDTEERMRNLPPAPSPSSSIGRRTTLDTMLGMSLDEMIEEEDSSDQLRSTAGSVPSAHSSASNKKGCKYCYKSCDELCPCSCHRADRVHPKRR